MPLLLTSNCCETNFFFFSVQVGSLGIGLINIDLGLYCLKE